jgi:hypothetical protein
MIPRLILALAGVNIAFAQNAAVGVQVYDYADLEPNVLRHFLALTQNILAGTRMSIQVKLCRGKGALCPQAVQGIAAQPLIVRILAEDTEAKGHSREGALGRSYIGPDGGSLASIFLAAVRDQAAAANVPCGLVLSYAAAHEIGHLLLGAQAHALRGVMKAHWDPSDYVDMFQNRCHFTREQAATLAGLSGNPVTLTASVSQEEEQ